jgi:hypothetical protein
MKPKTAIAFGFAAIWWTGICGTVARADQLVHTNKTRFHIPYRYDARQMQDLGAREIRLFASRDRGLEWQHVRSVEPKAERFEFQADNDGEYWFAVRTLDSRNQLHPSSNVVEPGLRVIVDTAPPTLSISLQQHVPGRVQLSWNAYDANIDINTLRLEYSQDGSGIWRPVSVVPQTSGQTSWSVPSGGFVAVRGAVADLASNVADAQRHLKVQATGDANHGSSVPDFRQPIAVRPRQSGTGSLSAPRGTGGLVPQPRNTFHNPLSPEPFASSPQRFATPQVTPYGSNSSSPGGIAQDRTDFAADEPTSRPNVVQPRYPSVANSAGMALSNGRTRIVRSTRFKIGYQLEDVGPSGISNVDLFITANNGQKWYKYGNDPDRISPFEVEVPHDGVYGFAIRVRSGVGLSADPPQPDERPSIIVLVDNTAPVVSKIEAKQGQGALLNKILIRWLVSDKQLADKPISLSYASDPQGPWEAISGWQPNSGSYEWSVGPGVPAKLYLRLTARDAAGNVSRAESPQPIIVDLAKPRARIVDVESVQSGQPGLPY